MSAPQSHRIRLSTGLSARLLMLTVLFVMLSEVLIYVPSIARFRKDDLEERIAKAHLAVLALEATPDNMVDKDLEGALLSHAGAYAIVLTDAERRTLMLGEYTPPPVDVRVDLREETVWNLVSHAFDTLFQPSNRILKVTGSSRAQPDATIEVIIDEAPLRDAMHAFSIRILTLSIIISLLTAGLVFFSLQWLMVRPIVQLTDAMMRFREHPEDDTATLTPSDRGDEIGVAQRELAMMQEQIRTALRQKSRLAALGAGMAKVNHDLRNALSTAALASDRLSVIPDPEVQRLAPKLYQAIDRAIALCTQTLDYVRDVKSNLHLTHFPVATALAEVEADLPAQNGAMPQVRLRGGELVLAADYEQFLRVLSNLVLNAVQAGSSQLDVAARIEGERALITLADDGPGIPRAQHEALFKPFAISARNGGSGLGLAIAREIVRAHGGELSLEATGPGGTTFRIELPLSGADLERPATP